MGWDWRDTRLHPKPAAWGCMGPGARRLYVGRRSHSAGVGRQMHRSVPAIHACNLAAQATLVTHTNSCMHRSAACYKHALACDERGVVERPPALASEDARLQSK